MVKFRRNYNLTITSSDGTLFIEPPFSIEFEVSKNTLGNAGFCVLRIYNLSQKSRDFIRKDQWSGIGQSAIEIKNITFNAGYGTKLSQMFKGTIQQAWSVREGVDFITEIHSYSGGEALVNAMSNVSIADGAQNTSVIRTLAENLSRYGVTIGAIGNYSGALSKAASYSGNTMEILKEMTGGGSFIDDERLYALQDNEIIDSDPFVVNSGTGLLGTPLRENIYVNFDMIMEPQLKIAHPILIESASDSSFNSLYKVTSIRHRGIISETVCGEAITSVGCLRGEFFPVSEATR